MLVAWTTLGTLGMMVARYLKGVAKGQTLLGKDVWFVVRWRHTPNVEHSLYFDPTLPQIVLVRLQVHFSVMSLTVAATATAFILPFTHIQSWSGVSDKLPCCQRSFV